MHRRLDLVARGLGLLERLENGGIAANLGISFALLIAAGLIGGSQRRLAVEPFAGRHGLDERLIVADYVRRTKGLMGPPVIVRPFVHVVHVATIRAELEAQTASHFRP